MHCDPVILDFIESNDMPLGVGGLSQSPFVGYDPNTDKDTAYILGVSGDSDRLTIYDFESDEYTVINESNPRVP